MKNLFLKLITMLCFFVLTSCGTSLERPKSNTDYKNIIGKPIKIGNIEIAQYDFPEQMNWKDANKACAELGDGWRLPTKDELNTLYQNKNEIGNFTGDVYWSSTEVVNSYAFAWLQYFNGGGQGDLNKIYTACVRAVRAF